MRARFLNTDYFAACSSPLEFLGFLNLPVPQISPSCDFTRKDDLRLFGSVVDVSLEIEQLPIASALSKFLSIVIPENFDVDYSDFETLRSPMRDVSNDEKESDILCVEKEEESRGTFGCETLKKDNEIAASNKNGLRFELFRFETPELPVLEENAFLFERDDFKMLSEVPEIDSNLDMVNQGFLVHHADEVQESVYLVENVALDYDIDQNSYLLEDDASVPDQKTCECPRFPCLEVDEISFSHLTIQSIEDVFLSVLENTAYQHWIQEDNLLISGKEILGSVDYDILDHISDHHLSEQGVEFEETILHMFPEQDIISMVESSQFKENSEFHHLTADGVSFLALSPVIFEEFHTFDEDSSNLFEAFLSTQTICEPVTCSSMFSEDMNFKNFSKLIISQELALLDETFKSLPIPVLFDHEETKAVHAALVNMLADVKLLPLSASDAIYLDWHILEDDKCSSELSYPCQKMLEEMDVQIIDFDLEPSDDGKLLFDFIFSDDALRGPSVERYEEELNIDSNGTSVPDDHLMGIDTGKLLDDGSLELGKSDLSDEKNSKNASCLFKSMSQFNDLDFFLNPRKTTTQGDGKSTINKVDIITPSSSSLPACLSTPSKGKDRQIWETTLHKVKLSDAIVTIINVLMRSYLAILQDKTGQNSGIASDDFSLPCLPKKRLMDCIDKQKPQKSTSRGSENIITFVSLCAINNMAWYTCFYGIHTARLYVDKLCQNGDCLKSRLGSLQSLIVAADQKVDKEITISHPSLSVIQGILQSNNIRSNLKVLILSEQIFWWSLKGLLKFMGLSYNELHNLNSRLDQADVCNLTNLTDSKLDALMISDCLLTSHEFVSESFPFNKFSLILEYGGSCGSSRVSALSPTLAGLPPLHFLKVELDDSSASRALCEGVYMPQNVKMGGGFHPMPNFKDNMAGQKLLELLSFLPVEKLHDMRSFEAPDADSVPSLVLCPPTAEKSKQIQQSTQCCHETIIIVNTQSCDKEMIVSRRSTYQKILAMEKEGIQVVERDSGLPVDVLISSAICLVWYDCENIGKKATACDEASSCLPFYVENIATSVLTLLSLTFSGCIMVFEGEVGFISNIMESSDGLYATAASLGIDLQLFCSYSSDLTDEIILSCIRNSFRLTNGLFPKMPESETLAEAFLAKFPSVNPLTAHAMLSSGGMLIELFECSQERRILSLQRYHVPDESVILFSTLCKFGEREDSKSILTDSSSSVSSGFDSDKYLMNTASERKMLQCISSPCKFDIHKDELRHSEPLNRLSDSIWNLPGVPESSDSRKDLKIFDQYEKQDVDLDRILPSRISKPYESLIQNESRDSGFSLKDKWLDQNEESELAWINNFDWQNIRKSKNLHVDFIGEVINCTSSPGNDFSLESKSLCPSSSMPEMENTPVRKSKIARRLAFDNSNHPTFPTAAEIDFGSEILSPQDHRRNILSDHPHNIYHNDNSASDKRKNLLEEVLARKSSGRQTGPFQEEISSYGGTPLSDAIRASRPQPGSPWTIEFLNRIREKSRLRQQSRPSETPLPCPGISSKISKPTKRRSPSILEFFKYQGGRSQKNLPEQKKQKQSAQSSSASNNRAFAPFPTALTPTDKRARKTLAFETNESGGQTTLIWSDRSAPGPSKHFPY